MEAAGGVDDDDVDPSRSGGLHGVILSLKDEVIAVKIAENVRVEMSRSAVSRVRDEGESKS